MSKISTRRLRNFLVEDFYQTVDDRLVVDNPELVTEAVFLGHKIINRLFSYFLGHDFIDFLLGRIGEEHRLHIGIGNADVNHAVFFLVLAGQLVLLDDVVEVVIDMAAGHQAILGAAVHRLGVHVNLFLRILHQPAVLLEIVVVFNHFVVNGL